MAQLQIALGGKAVVCCVHDRVKREVTERQQVVALGLTRGHRLGKDNKCSCGRFHFVKWCACCDNLFTDDLENPTLCVPCSGKPVHRLGGPLPEPKGEVS